MISLLALALLTHPSPSLPPAWHGAWAGTCEIAGGGTTGKFPMELQFAPKENGNFTFKLVYGEGDKKQVRDYELQPVKDKPGEFVTDEKNGIFIDARLVGNTLHSAFEVTGVLIHSRFELRDGAVLVEMTSFDTKKPRESQLKGKAEFAVKAYRLQSVQHGELKRVEPGKK